MLITNWLSHRFDARHPGELEERIHIAITSEPPEELPETKVYFRLAAGSACPGVPRVRDLDSIAPGTAELIEAPLLDLIHDEPPERKTWRAVLSELPWRIRRQVHALGDDGDDEFALNRLHRERLEAIWLNMDHYALAAFLAMILEAEYRGLQAQQLNMLRIMACRLFICLCVLPPFDELLHTLWPRLNERFFRSEPRQAGDTSRMGFLEDVQCGIIDNRRLALHALTETGLLPPSLVATRTFLALVENDEDQANPFGRITSLFLKRELSLDRLDESTRKKLEAARLLAEGRVDSRYAVPSSSIEVDLVAHSVSATEPARQKDRLRRGSSAASARSAGLTGQELHLERRTQLYAPDQNADEADDD